MSVCPFGLKCSSPLLLIFFLIVVSVIEGRVLKSQTILVKLLISPFNLLHIFGSFDVWCLYIYSFILLVN